MSCNVINFGVVGPNFGRERSHHVMNASCRRLIFIHLQCWEVLPFLTIQRQRCMKFRVLRAQAFYTPPALSCQKGQRLSALEVYKISL